MPPTWRAAWLRSEDLRVLAEAARAAADAEPENETLEAEAQEAERLWKAEAALAMNRKTRGVLANQRRRR